MVTPLGMDCNILRKQKSQRKRVGKFNYFLHLVSEFFFAIFSMILLHAFIFCVHIMVIMIYLIYFSEIKSLFYFKHILLSCKTRQIDKTQVCEVIYRK